MSTDIGGTRGFCKCFYDEDVIFILLSIVSEFCTGCFNGLGMG